jgi:branched-chain amino acid transport system ATP-binding protein
LSALELVGLRKSFGPTEIIRGTDLRVEPGERVALIGPNGAGKSTLFALVSGQLAPDAGSIRLNGHDITGQAPYAISRLGLGRSFQVSNLFGGLRVRDNLAAALMWRHDRRLGLLSSLMACRPLVDDVEHLLAELGLQSRADVAATDLSYAEQRALEIGLTIAGDPKVILLDEPTAGMSRTETARMIERVRRLSEGRTLLMIEHDMNVVFDLADRIAVLVYGRVIAFDRPEVIRADAQVRSAYLGVHADQTGR